MKEDKRNILRDEQPFSYKLIKDNKALVYWHQKMVKNIRGKEYNKLILLIEAGDAYEVQMHLAKITGNFKHGNEKNNKPKE